MIGFITKTADYINFLYHLDQIVFWTLVFLILYTYVTYKLWRESVRQTGLSLMPIPAFYFRGESTRGNLRVRNLGSKPLFNLEMEDWNMIIHKKNEKPDIWNLKYSVPFPNILKADEERTLKLTTYKNGAISAGSIWPHLHPEFNLQQIVPMKIKFQDVRGIKYTAKFAMGKGGLAMVKPPKKRGIYSFLSIDLYDWLIGMTDLLWFKIKFKFGWVK